MDGAIRLMILAAMENAQNLKTLAADDTATPIVDQSIHVMEMLSYLALAVEEESPETVDRLERRWHQMYTQAYTMSPPSGLVC